ncbi:MAG TPA: FHA domain-containing protein [Verrucomicrobiae bacterium]|nr:FHA domain-containing protein [Verrucomicrobiae bacterium]
MNRLLVNAGTPQAWEIQLKPGVNRIGRGEDNDFVINHGSVSTHHCEITLSDNGVLLKDLGSTNGTFINRAPTQEVWLQPGHRVQFGAVDLLFESDTVSAAAPASPASAPPIPIPVPVPTATMRPSGLRINLPGKAAPTETVAEAAEGTPLVEEEPEAAIDGGNNVCKSHQKTPARFLCNRCKKYFCDLCVTTRAGGKYCRTCGSSLTPLRVQAARPVAERGFYSRLPGAFIYPFRGFGAVILVFATIAFLRWSLSAPAFFPSS